MQLFMLISLAIGIGVETLTCLNTAEVKKKEIKNITCGILTFNIADARRMNKHVWSKARDSRFANYRTG